MKLQRLILSLLALAALLPSQSATDADDLRALVEHAFAAFQPVGLAVAVVEGDDILLEIGLGECAEGGGDPITAATPFNIASCTKAFTAASVGKLVAEGRIAWDDAVVEHLPEFRLADPWITRHLTVRDLLSHRSGLKTFEGDLLWYGSDYSDAQVLARLDRLPISKRFREEFGYQNLMYMVAGLLVERLSGSSWPEYLRAELLEPLGMSGTSVGIDGLPDDVRPAAPHIDGEPIEPVRFDACKPAGAIWSSVHDMSKWMRMLLAGGRWEGHKVLETAQIHESWVPHTSLRGGRTPDAMEDFSSYGLGWFLYVHDGKKLVEHDGGMPGFLSKVTLLPAERFGMVVLNNGNDGIVNIALRRAVLAQRQGGDGRAVLDRYATFAKARVASGAEAVQKREAARVPETSPSLPLDRYQGRYEDRILGPARVELADGVLQLVVEHSARALHGSLSHWHHDVFRVDFPDRFLPFALIRFSLAVDGEVEGFRIDCPIADFDFGALDFERSTEKPR